MSLRSSLRMGYDLHITRKADWSDAEGPTISEEEWRRVIEEDPELELDTDTRCTMDGGEYVFALWKGEPGSLGYYNGEITTKNPSKPLIREMVAIAQRLDANVQGDDGEVYDGTFSAAQKRIAWVWSSASALSCTLSLVALAMLAAVMPLDSFVRQTYPVGTPMPPKWAIALAALGMVGVFSWLVSTVFAIAAFLLRQPSLRYAAAALAINGATGAYVAMVK